MILPIAPINAPAAPEKPAAISTGEKPGGFASALSSAVQSVESARARSDASVEQLLSGDNTDLHSVLLDVQKAELALELFVQVRNKVAQAYQEIMRMPI